MSIDNFSMEQDAIVLESVDSEGLLDEAAIMSSQALIPDMEESIRGFKEMANMITFDAEDQSEALLNIFDMTRMINKAIVAYISKYKEYHTIFVYGLHAADGAISPYKAKLYSLESVLKDKGLNIHQLRVKLYRMEDSVRPIDFCNIFDMRNPKDALNMTFANMVSETISTTDIDDLFMGDTNGYVYKEACKNVKSASVASKEILIRLYDAQCVTYDQGNYGKLINECYIACINFLSAIIYNLYHMGIRAYNALRRAETFNTLALHADAIINAAISANN